jgi:rRNA-processing protein FCF1
MKRVIIDTNMLLVPGQHKVDIFTELDRVLDEPYLAQVLEGSVRELSSIADGRTSASADDRRAAKLAQMLIEHQRARDYSAASGSRCKGLKVVSGSADQHVDDVILAIADDDTLVATNDNGLKRRLLERGIRVIFLKQRQYLALSE